MDYCSPFKGKKITVMGLGLLGRGVGDTKFLAECGAELIVTDLKSEAELKLSLEKLKDVPNIVYHLGGHQEEDFRNRDMILKSAGVPLDSPFVAEAKRHGISVRMSADLLAKEAMKIGATVVGVTGTRGKSTVTHLIAHILKGAGKAVLLGGNIRGVSNLSLLPHIHPGSILVLELDSWQLQGFGEAKISPHIAVFTSFYPDHMNYYKSDMDRYLEDKAHIFKYQNKNDVLILGSQCTELIQRKYSDIQSRVIIAKPYDISYELKLLGGHNRYNAACAAKAAQALGVSGDIIRKTVAEFGGIPGRLEFLREIRGVKIYNDTTATTPDATLAGIKALSQNQNIVLILGGSDKGLDMDKLVNEIPNYCKKIITLAGTGTERIRRDLETVLRTTMIYHSNLQEAVMEAIKFAERGDIVLFSPAFASFGMFKNEYDRGDQFTKLVRELK
jgi:UDP-N-acetylmuramoylalanine--D-glutamate ligase